MSRIKSLSLVVLILLSFGAFAQRKEVREVFANDREMKTIYLTLGRSTILSFNDKPVKVVSGNSNYFNVEYIGNDLTLQPLSGDRSVPAHAADTFPDERSQLSCGEMKGRAFHELE